MTVAVIIVVAARSVPSISEGQPRGGIAASTQPLVATWFAAVGGAAIMLPATSSLAVGAVVPMPTLPSSLTKNLLAPSEAVTFRAPAVVVP